MEKGGKADFDFPAYYNTGLLVVEGEICINGKEDVAQDRFVLMDNNGQHFTIEAKENIKILIQSGESINESIASYGLFLVNTRNKLMQAFEDFNNDAFGYIEDYTSNPCVQTVNNGKIREELLFGYTFTMCGIVYLSWIKYIYIPQ
ncbi:MAG: hypothetical protein LC101_06020 [Flavobacteriales bacterium]|nr:hypothetical protein [Flavobacteriales bacterium]